MIKRYLFSAYWRKKDIDFLSQFELNREIREGFCGFNVDEKTHDLIINHFSKKSLLQKVKPKDFKVLFTGATFSKEELDNANYYMLCGIGESNARPMPENGYKDIVLDYETCNYVRIKKKQKAPFSIKQPKWKKNQLGFNFESESDFIFFKKEFYQEVLAPLGLKYIEVIDHNTGKPLEDTIQLDIPIAESTILIEGSAYDIIGSFCGVKQYSGQYLDFFPPFEKEFNFHICYTQEEFHGGFKHIIISKEFCNLLVKHNIIKHDKGPLIPMKKIIYD